MKLNDRQSLIDYREECKTALALQKKKILVCGGSGCKAAGSTKIYDEFRNLLERFGLEVEVHLNDHVSHGDQPVTGLKRSGCHGMCELGPLVRIEPAGVLYTKVKPADCYDIIMESIMKDNVVERLLYNDGTRSYSNQDEIPFYKNQTHLTLKNCGHIDAESLEEYIAVDGYTALEKALFEMTPDDLIKEVTDSGLRGRGGAGFPTGKKWSQVAAHKDAPIKYVVCNGDEGDPGAFMDCSVMEGDPHRMIEGMIIAGIATGSEVGYIYVRAEYPLAVKRLQRAITDARRIGLIGNNILGSGINFDLIINKGAGAFVCGEGSAMTASIEGHRGMPRTKPPRSVDQGLFGAPTSLNNVETYANITNIINNGAEWFRGYGTEGNYGTKTFSITGNIKHTGLVEVPLGTTLGEIIYGICGGMKKGEFKAVQIGGPSGGCLTKEHLDLPLDFDSTKKAGAIIGSGGLVVMGDDSCMVEIARFFINFIKKESCGKCTACREGVPEILNILERITHGDGKPGDIELLEELNDFVKNCSLCGLGKTATNPVTSTLRYFRDEYEAHIYERRCPAGVCKGMTRMYIERDKCIGCTKCARNCPQSAITGAPRQPHEIDVTKCIKCGICMANCPVQAIEEV